MLLSMHNFRSASEDTDSTATSQASMMTWVPFDFMACKVWENLLRLQSSWHLLVLTSHFRIKKGRPTSCSCLDHMVIFDELNLWNPSPLCCYRPRWSWFACTRCWAPSSARIFPWREVKTKHFMPSSTWVLSEKRVLRQTKVDSNKIPWVTQLVKLLPNNNLSCSIPLYADCMPLKNNSFPSKIMWFRTKKDSRAEMHCLNWTHLQLSANAKASAAAKPSPPTPPSLFNVRLLVNGERVLLKNCAIYCHIFASDVFNIWNLKMSQVQNRFTPTCQAQGQKFSAPVMSATPIFVRWGGSSGTTCTNRMLRLNVWRSMIQQAQIFQKKAQIEKWEKQQWQMIKS